MATYTVVFDGKWQGDFDSLHVAHNWARALGETGRIAYLTIRRGQSLNLVTALPEGRAREGRDTWMREARRWFPPRRQEASGSAVPEPAEPAPVQPKR